MQLSDSTRNSSAHFFYLGHLVLVKLEGFNTMQAAQWKAPKM
jgi:hypothetical protein